jgi:hypothetical protein
MIVGRSRDFSCDTVPTKGVIAGWHGPDRALKHDDYDNDKDEIRELRQSAINAKMAAIWSIRPSKCRKDALCLAKNAERK